jgi:urease accessory protein
MRSLELFLRGRLRTAGLVAAGLAAAACECARTGDGYGACGGCDRARGDGAGGGGPAGCVNSWAALDAEADARTPSPAQREASRRQGRALLRAARVAWPDARGLAGLANATTRNTADAPLRKLADIPPRNTADTADRAQRRAVQAPHHPIVLGAAVAAGGGDPADAAAVAAYQSVTGPASAEVRLLSLDPIEVSGLLARLSGDIDEVAEQAARAANAARASWDELPFSSGPTLDLLAEAHARAEVRLFAS